MEAFALDGGDEVGAGLIDSWLKMREEKELIWPGTALPGDGSLSGSATSMTKNHSDLGFPRTAAPYSRLPMISGVTKCCRRHG